MGPENTVPAAPPFDLPHRLGVCLSGGGYRAAAFHLGVLDLFERVGLLSKVVAISTVSGGSFVGARWALSLARGESFESFFHSLYGFLKDTDCIEAALSIPARRYRHRPSGRHSLITAAADTYSRSSFLGNARFGELWQKEGQLKHIVFNTTEFHTGLGFRFQHSSAGYVGNGNWRLKAEAAGQARLADIVAASSCFPGGFEPICFPEDFVWGHEGPPSDLWASNQPHPAPPKGLALMDGGIYDNQGIDALLMADKRASALLKDSDNFTGGFDLIFISDADQKSSQPFFCFEEPPARGFVGYASFRGIELTVRALSLVSAWALIEKARPWSLGNLRSWFEWLFPTLALLAIAVGPSAARLWFRRSIPKPFESKVLELVNYFKHKKMREGLQLLILRAQSLYAMAANVFMNRIRGLQLDRVLRDPTLRSRVITNFIYELLEVDEAGANAYPEWLLPSRAQLQCVERGQQMGTQLWFDDDQQLPNVVAAGQSTACFNLLEYCRRLVAKGPASEDLLALEAKLEGIWEELKANPLKYSGRRETPSPGR